ncbi:hypothetical protein A3G50_00530 [Candidatus Jorgensenbacteria bacterium RIFCSPLOWO2_12_FULL_42_11]|uniref:3D domain-containing protein n=1 Tax=Candidatus Jorgensenbacteria bacterium RIFCSPLOWO2_12_FULL_42_11 TaxID=1798473 RepID=A0A1F6C0Z9_9BACT|nr:MAG: hypothetical protein A3G50_00530 [Candidatus Jorgensenbacteria bacterium RIFCSPLOWO2_12_FULL_42_11]
MIKNMNKQYRLSAFLVFFNLTPSLIFPGLMTGGAIRENKAKTDYLAEAPARFNYQVNASAVLRSSYPSEMGLQNKYLLEETNIGQDRSVNPETDLITITAYSSTPDQTDSTPFITASGSYVEDGIVAANFLAFDTKIRLPELYGEKIFTVKDRMAKKNSHKIDIWFPARAEAEQFGVKKTRVEIIGS